NVDFAVARYNPDGNLDPTFGVGGKVTIDFGSPTDFAAAVAVQADGGVVVAGFTDDSAAGTGLDFALAPLTSAGRRDPSSGTGGRQPIDFGGRDDQAAAVAVQADGSVVVAGSSIDSASLTSDFAVARLTGTGQLDANFGTGGKQTLDLGTADDE